MLKRTLFYIVLILMLVACKGSQYDLQGLFCSSPEQVNTRFRQSMAYNDSAQYYCQYKSIVVPNQYHVYVCSDSHVDTTMKKVENMVSDYLHDPQAMVAIHLGDLVDNVDMLQPFLQCMNRLPHVFYALGNHDKHFGRWSLFSQYLHTSVYWFETRSEDGDLLDLYVCFDTAEGQLGYLQWQWVEALLKDAAIKPYRHRILYSHTNLFRRDNSQKLSGNNTIEDTYHLIGLMHQYNVDMYWSGHDHSGECTTIGGVISIVLDEINDASNHPRYMYVEMDDKIQYQFVDL